MKKFVVGHDFHIGLFTDQMSRTDEIISVMLQLVKHAVTINADGVVFLGDIFNHNDPSSDLIKKLMKVINVLKKAGIKIWFVPGNHDTVADSNRRSCLDFIDELKVGYENIRYIPEIKTIRLFRAEVGDCYWTFLPDIKKAHINKKYKNVQEFIDKKAKAINKKIPKSAQHFIFSHLNVVQAVAGSEEFLLKRSQIYVPSIWTTDRSPLKPSPIIINAHIHTKQKFDNIYIGGSPIFVGFGEKEKEKYFLELHIPEYMGEGSDKFIYHKTKCKKFQEYSFDIHDNNFDIKKIFKPIKKELSDRSIVKVNLNLHESVSFPIETFEKMFKDLAFHVKPIIPKIKRDKIVRNKKQTSVLEPKDAIRLWLKTNKPKGSKKKLTLADTIIDEVTG